MSTDTALVTSSSKLSTFLGIEKGMMIETIKAQCFKGKNPNEVSDAQLASFISVATVLELNPLIPGMLYAYPERNGGITPIVGPDGTFKKLSELKGVSYQCDVFPEDINVKPTHAVALIYVEGKEHPHKYTAAFNEWYVDNNPNWKTRPRHMLWLRAIKQCARQVVHGLPMDEDERHIASLLNVTGTGEDAPTEATPARKLPPARSEKGVAAATAAKDVTPSKPLAPVIDIKTSAPATATQPANEPAAAAKPADVAVEPPAKPAPQEKVPEPPAKEKTVTPLGAIQLEDGKEYNFEADVDSYVVKAINNMPDSVQANVKGPYTGVLYHLGGKCDAWQIEKPVRLHVLGKKLKNGSIAGMVQAIAIVGAQGNGGDLLE